MSGDQQSSADHVPSPGRAALEPPLGSTGIRQRIESVPVFGKGLSRLLNVPSPFYRPASSPGNRALRQLLAAARRGPSKPRILNIGSESARQEGVIRLDIAQHGSADLIADATHIPLKDASIDLVICVAVLEHVKDPGCIAAEFLRVLKPGGKLYCAIPFFQMFHADPIDMQRYTVTGIVNLLRDFRCLENGVELGPASATALTLREFLAILFCFDSKILYNLLQVVFGYLTMPIKYLDHFLSKSQWAFMIACSVYFVGEKAPVGAPSSDRALTGPG